MLTYKTGNLLDASAEALVNTVNTVGVMGKGIALQFKHAFPEAYTAYRDAVKQGSLRLGAVQVVPVRSDLGGTKYVIHFPTKAHWRSPSQLEWIRDGLGDLRAQLLAFGIHSVAVPPLGCGNGGLRWEDVKPEIEKALGDLPLDVQVYEPSASIEVAMSAERTAKAARLTRGRALLLHLLYRYRALGEFASEFAAEKLMYFLVRAGEPDLKLTYTKGMYGPYSGAVRHLLYAVNGYYLRGFEQKSAKPFQPLELDVSKRDEVRAAVAALGADTQRRLAAVDRLIEGFETPYGLELLATVDFLMRESGTSDVDALMGELRGWSARKGEMFSREHVGMAVGRLGKWKD